LNKKDYELECPKCGLVSDFGTRFCEECGQSLEDVQIEIEEKYEELE
jgi:uncharacterized OB-fold protein